MLRVENAKGKTAKETLKKEAINDQISTFPVIF